MTNEDMELLNSIMDTLSTNGIKSRNALLACHNTTRTVNLPDINQANPSFKTSTNKTNLVNSNKQFKIYPNPASNQITISTTDNQLKAKYQLYNTAGKLLKSGNINSENFKVNLNGIENGIYLLKFSNNFSQILSEQKLIIIR